MSKADQLRAMREARAKRGAKIAAPKSLPKTQSLGGRPVERPNADRSKRPNVRATGGSGPAPKARHSQPKAVRPKVGRPRIEDKDTTLEATKPWLKAEMSRATWYRRQAEGARK